MRAFTEHRIDLLPREAAQTATMVDDRRIPRSSDRRKVGVRQVLIHGRKRSGASRFDAPGPHDFGNQRLGVQAVELSLDV